MGEVFYFHQKIIGFEVNTFGQSLMNTMYMVYDTYTCVYVILVL